MIPIFEQLTKPTLASVLSVFLSYSVISEDQIPSKNFSYQAEIQKYDWEKYTLDLPYDMLGEYAKLSSQVAILHHMASLLLSQSVDLEPEVVQLVDREFWSLI